MQQSPRPHHVLEHGPPLMPSANSSEILRFRLRLRLSETQKPSPTLLRKVHVESPAAAVSVMFKMTNCQGLTKTYCINLYGTECGPGHSVDRLCRSIKRHHFEYYFSKMICAEEMYIFFRSACVSSRKNDSLEEPRKLRSHATVQPLSGEPPCSRVCVLSVCGVYVLHRMGQRPRRVRLLIATGVRPVVSV